MTSPRNPFRPAARVMLFGAVVSFAAAGAAAFLWMSPGHVPAGIAAGTTVDGVSFPSAGFAPRAVSSANRPAIDDRRLAANEPQPGVFGDATGGAAPPSRPFGFPRPLPATGHLDDLPTAQADHSRPVPDPRLAFAEEPAAAPERSADVETRPFPGQENEKAHADPSVSSSGSQAKKGPAEDRSLPLVQVIGVDSDGLRSELRDLRRAFDELSRSEVSEQTRELKRIRRRLSELEAAPAVEGLRESIRDLQAAMAAQHAETVARIDELKEQTILQESAPDEPQPPAGPISIAPGAVPETWTIHLADARLSAALQAIASRASLNVVSPPDLDVPVTATLSDVTAQEAIASLASAYGKTVREEGRFLRIETAASPVEAMDLPAPAVPLPMEPAAIPETAAAPPSLITPPVAGTPELRTQVFRLRHISRAVAEPIVRTMLSSDGAILDSSDELSLDPAILRTSLIVRDAEPTLSAVAKYLAVTDIPKTAVELEVKVLSVELRDRAERGVRQSLNALLTQSGGGAPVCPKCGRRHSRTDALSPECTLAEPTWSTRGEGWDLAQFRGRPSDFVSAFQTTLPIAELAAPRMRVASDAHAVLRLRDLILESPRSGISTVAFENAGDSVDIVAKPLDDERVELVLHSSTPQPAGTASHAADESSTSRKASVTVQSGCTVVLAGVRIEPTAAQVFASRPGARGSANNAARARKEVVLLVCPRIVEDQPAAQ